VFLGLEAQFDGRRLQRLVDSGEFLAARPKAGPDDADVVGTREDAQPPHLRLEGVDVDAGDRFRNRGPEFVDAVLRDVSQKFHRDVRLRRIGETQSLGVGELLLEGFDLRRQFRREVDAQEQPHAT
jgi:hypothetical protein